jgi:Big-like domain-containing protein
VIRSVQRSLVPRVLSAICAAAPLLGVALIAVLDPSAARAQIYYLRSTAGQPWASNSNEQAMDAVFGAGNWVNARYETVNAAVLLSNSDFIFMEGGDFTSNEMESFLSANAAAINTFVNDGGVIFFNAAPNEGNGMSFGFGVSLIYPSTFCNFGCNAVSSQHPIFNGPFVPVGTSFSGNSFSHATLVGSFTPLIQDSSGRALLAEATVGRGLVLFGGMTTSNFHSPQPNANNLRRNILAYAAAHATKCAVIDAIDDQFSVINDGKSAEFLVLANDECADDTPISVVVQAGDLQPDRGGSAFTNGSKVTYRPAPGFVGFEQLLYTAQDAGLLSGDSPAAVDRDRATVVVDVVADLAPNAVDDATTTLQAQAVVIDVLANDALGNAPDNVVIATAPAHGTATVQADHTIRYVPNSTFFGPDSFQYRLTDANGDSDVATVTLGVFFVSGQIPIDIMPNDAGNNLNLRSGPGSGFDLAILSVGEYFDAPALIDPLSLKLGPREANIWGDSGRVHDVNGDGYDDLVVKFLTDQIGIACGDTSVNLNGRTTSYQYVSGSDQVNTFNCPRARKRY